MFVIVLAIGVAGFVVDGGFLAAVEAALPRAVRHESGMEGADKVGRFVQAWLPRCHGGPAARDPGLCLWVVWGGAGR